MEVQSQSNAVYNATINTLKENDITFTPDETKLAEVMTPDIRRTIVGLVTEGLANGSVSLKDTLANKAKLADPAKLKSYANGLVSNWHRKDKRFNLGAKYETKNKGSRTGQGDVQLKALKSLFKKFNGVDTEQATKIDEAITQRITEIQAERVSNVEINADDLPENFRYLV